MPNPLEYHTDVRRLFPPTVALFSLIAISLFFVPFAKAQINAPPTSVTSPGFGGRPVNGPPASVTSVGPRGYAPNGHVPYALNGTRNGARHRHRNGDYSAPYLYAFPVPYAVDNSAVEDDADAGDDDPNYQGGPTVFDRRGSGARSYVPPVQDVPAPHANQADDSSSDSDPSLPPTLLIFKDGRKLEIGNYAIQGSTLFDLTPGHPRRIALADLDLEATRQQNEERGVVFELPPSLQAN